MKYAFSGDISEPVVGDYVKKCGATSGCNENDKVCNCKKIYSTNAIIKVSGGSFSGKVFKNQILIHKFSEGGDSGSLIVDKNHDIVGLLFARSLEPYKFSVANNINYIFNHRFSINQDVYLDGQKISINQFNLKRFI